MIQAGMVTLEDIKVVHYCAEGDCAE